jgi:hypothetical protein
MVIEPEFTNTYFTMFLVWRNVVSPASAFTSHIVGIARAEVRITNFPTRVDFMSWGGFGVGASSRRVPGR